MATALARVAGPACAMEGANCRAASAPLASTRAVAAPLRPSQGRRAALRRAAVPVRAVASPVAKSSAPAKKGAAISAEEGKALYRDMFLGREFEEMCAQMYYRGKMFGFVHLYSGQEAVSTGEPSPRVPQLAARACTESARVQRRPAGGNGMGGRRRRPARRRHCRRYQGLPAQG